MPDWYDLSKDVNASGMEAAKQEEPQQNKAEKARDDKDKADASYNQLVNGISPKLEEVAATGYASIVDIEDFRDEILDMLESNEPALLFENMQVIRVERDVGDGYFKFHAINVAMLNAMMGRMLRITDDELDRLVKLGLVMDFGMMRLPPQLKERNRKFTPEDIAVLRTHPNIAAEILENSGEKDEALLEAVRCHHERFDGSGYPQGKKGSAIPEIARVAAIADMLDAAMARKKYSQQKSPFEVLSELLENPGMKMDPSLTMVAVNGFANMLVGRYVVLSDRSIAKVLSVDLNNLTYPVVKVVNRKVQTGPQLYPVELSSYYPLF